MSLTTLKSLANLISESITAIEQLCIAKNLDVPCLDKPFALQTEAPLMDLDIGRLAKSVIAASSQLTAMLTPVPFGPMTASLKFHISSALRVAVETNVIEILREAGPSGLHVDEISLRNGIDANKLGRILRLLATEHIFKEISPDVFTNNRLSSALDTGKDVKTLFERPDEKYVGTSGVSAAIAHFTDDQFKSSAYLLEALSDPEFVRADNAMHTAFNKAFKTDMPIFTWFEQPGNESRLLRFGITFESGSRLFPPKAILDGYNWGALPEDSVVVDVGGGVGTQTMILAKAFPLLKYIVQDRAAVIADGIKYFQDSPDLLASGTVTLQAHDFLAEQPVKNARVYFMRMIMHDWTDSVCIQILQQLRAAAGPESEVIIIDNLMQYACEDTTVDNNVPGMGSEVAPPPLLPNYGHANIFPYLGDLQMLGSLNGVERTPAQFGALLHKSGWKMKSIHRALIGFHKVVACVA